MEDGGFGIGEVTCEETTNSEDSMDCIILASLLLLVYHVMRDKSKISTPFSWSSKSSQLFR